MLQLSVNSFLISFMLFLCAWHPLRSLPLHPYMSEQQDSETGFLVLGTALFPIATPICSALEVTTSLMSCGFLLWPFLGIGGNSVNGEGVLNWAMDSSTDSWVLLSLSKDLAMIPRLSLWLWDPKKTEKEVKFQERENWAYLHAKWQIIFIFFKTVWTIHNIFFCILVWDYIISIYKHWWMLLARWTDCQDYGEGTVYFPGALVVLVV